MLKNDITKPKNPPKPQEKRQEKQNETKNKTQKQSKKKEYYKFLTLITIIYSIFVSRTPN